MGYRVMGRVHAALSSLRTRQSGQGTVEYVGLILLVAVVLAGVVAATKGTNIGSGQIGETILKKLKSALDAVH
jgi:hypothetical protein